MFTKFQVQRGLLVIVETMPDAKCELRELGFNWTSIALVGRLEMLFQQGWQAACMGKAGNNSDNEFTRAVASLELFTIDAECDFKLPQRTSLHP